MTSLAVNRLRVVLATPGADAAARFYRHTLVRAAPFRSGVDTVAR